MNLNKFFHENKLALSVIGIIIGLPLTLISAMTFMYTNGDTGLLRFVYDFFGFGEWAFWIIIPSLFMLIIGSYFVWDFYRKMKEFRSLMTIESKAKFIKNIDRIEFLAWSLHPNYERVVIEKKKKYKMR